MAVTTLNYFRHVKRSCFCLFPSRITSTLKSHTFKVSSLQCDYNQMELNSSVRKLTSGTESFLH